jgi:hypothetical protein
MARLTRGFAILIDYGHEARELYSVSHSGGTLTTFARHTSRDAGAPAPPWLERPGDQDLTAHVDFTSVRLAAESAGCVTLAFLDQTYFLLALAESRGGARAPPPPPPTRVHFIPATAAPKRNASTSPRPSASAITKPP